jgi:hypothetical protein
VALVAKGFTGTVGQVEFSQLENLGDGVVSSLPADAALRVDRVVGQDRRVTIQPGASHVPGARAAESAVRTYDFPANSSGLARLDWLVMRYSWSADPGTCVFIHVQGTPAATPQAPTLTQTAGVQWDVPLALVRVDSGVGSFPADAVRDARYWDMDGIAAQAVRSVDPPHRAGRLLYVVGARQLYASDGAAWSLVNTARTSGAVTAASGWSDYGGSQLAAGYSATSDGRVQLQGMLRRTTAAGSFTVDATGDQIGSVPVGVRPAGTATYTVATKVGPLRLDVTAAGQLILRSDTGALAFPATTGFVALDGLAYWTS